MNYISEMHLSGDEALYNIGVVSRMTGISMATLRAWERRYDFPQSERTDGGHRLYTERDILRLRWVKERIDNGMQTAQSINALRHQEKTGNLFFSDVLKTPQNSMSYDYSDYFESIKKRLLNALEKHDVLNADEIFTEGLASISPDDMIVRVIGPLLSDIGESWEVGKIFIATEHLATNYLRQRLMMWMLSGPPIKIRKPIVLACAPEEWHEGSLLIIGAILRRRRYPVAYLGQSLPLDDLVNYIKEITPLLVVVVAMHEVSVKNLIDLQPKLSEIFDNDKPLVGYGGRVFVEKPEWRQKIQGIYLGSSIEEGIATIERIIG